MTAFTKQLEPLLIRIVASEELHAKWLNTLSFLENCGARKIAACEHPTLVKEEMLKHAAEEFRHAHYLKRQIQKVSPISVETYSLSCMLGGVATLHYLSALDLQTSRYLKKLGLTKPVIKELAYFLVTYAIELRAEELYPLYDAVLCKTGSRVAVKSILLEEREHLKEMEKGINEIPLGHKHAKYILTLEEKLCKRWLDKVAISLQSYQKASGLIVH